MAGRSMHPFPARMAPEIALDAIPERTSDALTVLDPMCGSGTVLSVALQRGHNAVGVDIDPLAVMMSQLAVTKIDTAQMLTRAADAVATSSGCAGYPPWRDDDETDEFVDFWFGPTQKRELIALATAIDAVDNQDQKLALRLALSRIIVTKSPKASLAADTSHSRPHRVISESNYDVLAGFQLSAKQLAKFLEQRSLRGQGQVEIGDARALTSVADGTADLAVTSPPYLNALDYLRGHKLALVWFGHTIAELRARRGVSIGSERGFDGVEAEILTEIVQVIESEAVDLETLKRPMVKRYAHDCVQFASQLHRTVKPGGTAVLVVGNSTLRGNYIKNSQITQKSMEAAGFKLVDSREREIPSSHRYMAISAKDKDSRITKRMRSEVVLTMER